ncbi:MULTISPECIES: DUF6095 family protein [Mesonia]|jgi:hypothetical protein|uniref:Uncharacterized protein n=1 Tax=Mesonia algae TaxID=213248 RepID=A0A2W7I2X2_9FLAO|nr:MULTISPECIES: DUF6095 family protein [Mesonia]PZW40638.1 hypothetical protein LX95_01706 [Mesonia algae]TXK73008.1 hypothetical protein FT986_13485 [Mesonia sp. K4-1]
MKRTNKEVLFKGLRYLAGAMPLIFLGPSILYSAFNNREHPLYIAVLILGIIACGGAIFLIFKGINTLMKALFDS